MINKLITICLILCPFISTASHAEDVRGLFVGAGYIESRTLYYGHIDNGGLVEAGYDFNELYSIDTKIVRTGGDDFKLNFIGVNIGHTFNSSWIRVYGKVGVADITAKGPHKTYVNDEEYENSKPGKRSTIALGAGVRFTPFSEQSGAYAKLELLAEGAAPLYTPFGMLLTFGYKF
jgi:hypothetical protein